MRFPLKFILILCSLSITTTFALSPTLTKSYFFVNPDNRLSYELFQTPEGIIGHTIDTQPSNPISRYLNINLSTKDSNPILSDIVRDCDTSAAPTFQHIHYHVQTNSLVYFCAANASLLIINQVSFTVQTVIPFNVSGSSWPVATLSTDDNNSVAILLMDTLFSPTPRASVLCKVDMQTKALTTQIQLNQNLAMNENVVAYAAGKNAAYIATNRIQDQDLSTTVYSIAIIGSTYQLAPIQNFTFPINPTKVITKLFAVGGAIAVNNGGTVYFLSPQGRIMQTGSAQLKSLTRDGLFHLAFTAKNGESCLYIQLQDGSVGKYTVYETAVILFKLPNGPFADMQIAYANTETKDLIFTIDQNKEFFKIWDQSQGNFKTIYTIPAGYSDLFLTDTTYAVIQEVNSPALYIFGLKNDSLIAKVPIGRNNYYYEKEQGILTFPHLTTDAGCRLGHVDLVSGQTWNTLYLDTRDYSCVSVVVKARYNGIARNPDVVLSFFDHYEIFSSRGWPIIQFRTPLVQTDRTNLNIDFDDLSFYYLISNQAQNQVNASYYTFNSQTIPATFQLQSTNLISSAPVSSNGFFNVNLTMSVALYSNNFVVIDKLNSSHSFSFPNKFNYASSFQDDSGSEYVLLAYADDGTTLNGSKPELFNTNGGNLISVPGFREDTVSGRVTGSKSFALYDDLHQSVGLIRFYNANASAVEKSVIPNLRYQRF